VHRRCYCHAGVCTREWVVELLVLIADLRISG